MLYHDFFTAVAWPVDNRQLRHAEVKMVQPVKCHNIQSRLCKQLNTMFGMKKGMDGNLFKNSFFLFPACRTSLFRGEGKIDFFLVFFMP